MKQAWFLLFLFLSPVLLFAQQSDTPVAAKTLGGKKKPGAGYRSDSSFFKRYDTAKHKPDFVARIKKRSVISKRSDSLKAGNDSTILKSKNDSLTKRPGAIIVKADSVAAIKKDSVINHSAIYATSLQRVLKANTLLNYSGKPFAMDNHLKTRYPGDNFFYLLTAIALLLCFFRYFYSRYFNNLFRVFFNASLRQSQLTDQLLQAKLPSLFFNIVFIFTGGMYVYLLLRHYEWISPLNFWIVVLYCTLSLGFIYLVKFITVKFTGWLTGYRQVTDTYIFIIFLINKILGVLLLPFSIIIAFAVPSLATAAVIISLLLIGLMFVLRFFRSYGLLQHQLRISKFLFLLYVFGVEIVPVLLIYKGLVLLLSKNL